LCREPQTAYAAAETSLHLAGPTAFRSLWAPIWSSRGGPWPCAGG
jgi:hypothetical protein